VFVLPEPSIVIEVETDFEFEPQSHFGAHLQSVLDNTFNDPELELDAEFELDAELNELDSKLDAELEFEFVEVEDEKLFSLASLLEILLATAPLNIVSKSIDAPMTF
jgi:hypothetical protein